MTATAPSRLPVSSSRLRGWFSVGWNRSQDRLAAVRPHGRGHELPGHAAVKADPSGWLSASLDRSSMAVTGRLSGVRRATAEYRPGVGTGPTQTKQRGAKSSVNPPAGAPRSNRRRTEDAEVPAIEACDRARPVPLSQDHDRCIRHANLLVPGAGDDLTSTAKALFEPPWTSWRLRILEARMEPWTPTSTPISPHSGVTPLRRRRKLCVQRGELTPAAARSTEERRPSTGPSTWLAGMGRGGDVDRRHRPAEAGLAIARPSPGAARQAIGWPRAGCRVVESSPGWPVPRWQSAQPCGRKLTVSVPSRSRGSSWSECEVGQLLGSS